ncbi:MAG: HD domain-containing protein [Myxococcales bacterium]|nr:HD domain-containing protein [Myxococcales bacterium]
MTHDQPPPIDAPPRFDDPIAMLGQVVAIALDGNLPAPAATEAARALGAQIRALPPATVRDLFTAMLVGHHVHLALQWLHDAGVLALWLTELEATVDFSQEAGRRHKDVWEHTKQVVRQAVPRPDLRWAALLHDIGKVPTRTFTPDGGVHFHRHSEVGARMFEDVARRFAFDKPTRHKVKFLVLHHLRANQYDGSWTDSAVRRFDREMALHLDDLLDLSRADITSKRPGKREAALRSISELARRIEALRAEDAIQPPLPPGIGNVIMERFALPPSRRIGELREALEAAIDAGALEPRREAEYYLAHVAKLLEPPGNP